MGQETEKNNIVRTLCMFVEFRIREANNLFMVMEMLEGPDLFDFIATNRHKGLQEHVVAGLTLQMCTAVHHVHRVVGMIHRDIKPENFGFVRPVQEGAPLPTLNLFDFGLAHILEAPVTEETAATVHVFPKRCGTAVY